MNRAHGEFAFDWAHNNTCQVIGTNSAWENEKVTGNSQIFKPGNIFISYRSSDVIAVIDRDCGEIVWAWGPGVLDGQHKPHMLENGNILIFDNGTLRGYSRVIELNPLTMKIEWEYTSEIKKTFHSRYISSAQRLPNGNTLICEGSKGRLFEVTPEKDVVWDYINPHGTENTRSNVYRCLRYSPEYAAPLLNIEK
jgi:outer membrane protein assembly factor BamB